MALLLLLPPPLCSSSSAALLSSTSIGATSMNLPSPSLAIAANPFSRLQKKNCVLQSGHFYGIRLPTPSAVCLKRSVIVRSATDDLGKDTGSLDLPVEGSGESQTVDKLPLESKLQERLEQKLRMKLAKKIRLRRKRLVRKRHLRKKGRWPPSKMKKNKNV